MASCDAVAPRRSWLRFGVPIVLSLLFLVPSGRFYYWIVEEELTSLPSPEPGKPIVDQTDDIGGGFRRVALSEYVEGGFESVYHGEYLFYRDRKLADWLSASVSPSRQFAIYRELDSNRLLLFRVADQRTTELLPTKSDRNTEEFVWNEVDGSVALRSSSELRTFPLN
jgi:hypothetical protein